MNMSLLGVLLVCGLAIFASVSAVLAYATVARDARCRRRRGQLRLVVGAGATASRRPGTVRQRPAHDAATPAVSWDPLPVTQWQPPREHDPEPSPAA